MKKETVAESLEKFPNDIEDASELGNIKVLGEVDNIVVSGIGASGIAGDLLKSYIEELGLKLPVFVNKEFEIPTWANSKTLMFIISYSGNTLEALKCYKSSIGRGCKTIVISSDGKLKRFSTENNIDFIRVPEEREPRATLPYLFIPMIQVLRFNNIITEQIDFSKIAMILRKPGFKEKAEIFAKKLISRTPILYASERFKPVAMRWKNEFNENAKIPAFYSVFPELCHNEVEAYEEPFEWAYIVIIRDDYENKYVKAQMDAFKKAVKGKVEVTELRLSGEDYLVKVLSAIYLGDLMTVELGELLEKDINDIPLIKQLEDKLKGVY